MTDQKMIEEMARDMANCEITCDECFKQLESAMTLKVKEREKYCLALLNCKTLYEHGCRKLSESSVVLTKEEHTSLINEFNGLQHKYNDICDRYRLCKDANETIKQNLVIKVKEMREQTAREIFNKIFALHGNRADIMYFEIEELAKQYGVEVE